jgi:hypothetical protein
MKTLFKIAILSLLALILLVPESGFSQTQTTTTFRFGQLNPKDAKSGLMLGFNHGVLVDERVDVGFSTDIFWKSYTKETLIDATTLGTSVTESTYMREIDFKTILLPIMATVNVRIPMEDYSPVFFILGGGIGWEFLFNQEKNYTEDKEDKRFYNGFGYMLNAGVLYQIGSRSAILAELGYNGSKVSRSKDTVAGLPVWNEVNVSGFMFRVGLRLGLL